MSTAFTIICLLLFTVAIVSSIVYIIKRIAKKETVTKKVALWSAVAGVLCFIIAFFVKDLSLGLSLVALIAGFTAAIALLVSVVKWVVNKRVRKERVESGRNGKRISKPVAVFLGAVLLCVVSSCLSNSVHKAALNNPENYEVKTVTTYDFDVVDGTEPIEIVSSTGFEKLSQYKSRFHNVYESSDNHLLFDKTNPTVEDCLEAVRNNPGLEKRFKDYFIDFINRIGAKYPNADLTILYHNLATLKVVELDKTDFVFKSWSIDSYGCYRIDENTIYIPEGTEYKEGTWGFQVLIHEFCHVVRTARWDGDDVTNVAKFDTTGHDNTLLMEAMNSVFSCSLLTYYERDIAYQVASNYLRIMLECMDNYSLSDYINHGDTYFLSKLDEYTGHTNYAEVIWKLIAVQRSDYDNENMQLTADEYYPIYDYICKMYYDKYITKGMTAGARKAVADELVDKAFFDAPEEYTISPEYFYTYLDNYVAGTA